MGDVYSHIIRVMKRANRLEQQREPNQIFQTFQVGTVKGFHGIFGKEVLHYLQRLDLVKAVERNFYIRFGGIKKSKSKNMTGSAPRSGRTSAQITPTVYVVDSGIQINHPEFEGRASEGIITCSNCTENDEDGHGTHVAGIIASRSHGIFPHAKLVSVKVKEGEEGDMASMIQGLAWIQKHVQQNRVTNALINISISTPFSVTLNSILEEMIDRGMHVIASAGNQEIDACDRSPGSANGVITVGAAHRGRRASFSNYGSCIDVFAPGVDILSTWYTMEFEKLSGTSMAAPYVTGELAYLISQGIDRKDLLSTLIKLGTESKKVNHPPSLETPLMRFNTLKTGIEKGKMTQQSKDRSKKQNKNDQKNKMKSEKKVMMGFEPNDSKHTRALHKKRNKSKKPSSNSTETGKLKEKEIYHG
ncbi:serine protease [Coelomomyces lativittatus]|nr:serine protease [Coelomomyces lativittatus]